MSDWVVTVSIVSIVSEYWADEPRIWMSVSQMDWDRPPAARWESRHGAPPVMCPHWSTLSKYFGVNFSFTRYVSHCFSHCFTSSAGSCLCRVLPPQWIASPASRRLCLKMLIDVCSTQTSLLFDPFYIFLPTLLVLSSFYLVKWILAYAGLSKTS